ncbi:L-lysine exporter family protein LysE/ArgO [Alkalihalobacillus xiaoxiensis]|uniref:L-lysine exporter family protein LysE/ArgO n=1 Tax=Shouchella xiaoxiensis TaxID=766895 RepID=A0ABS2SW86_9BACI|nr:LysE family transporter [Shouchella xiaoxiensis]MBM7839782.1 L-lysine exporter family protein LysE/ArgO [Shouchella xiaoxiensis]
MLYPFFHGLILSVALILPLGPQNMFIFNQGAMQPQFQRVLPVVFTAALCDTLLILASVFGVSVLLLTLPQLQLMMYVVGFLFLLYIGWSIWTTDTAPEVPRKPYSIKKQILFAISVSVLNPHAILDTVGVIGSNAAQYTNSVERFAFTFACILVSWIAFVLLAVLGRFLKRIDRNGQVLKLINKGSALTIWIIALLIGSQIMALLH